MQNVDIRFRASSSFSKVQADLAALEAQAASLGAVFDRNARVRAPALVDPQSWQRATTAIDRASNAYRNAISSSGVMTTQQIRATSETERYTKALQSQKLSMQDMWKHRGIMKEVYRDQLRYQRMTAQYWGTDVQGRAITDIAVPKSVPKDLDTMRRKLGMFGNVVSSASTQVINLGKNMQWAGRQLTVGFTYPMVLFGAAAGMMAYKVEDSFGQINKVYDYSSAALRNQNVLLNEQTALREKSMAMAETIAKRYGLTVEKTLAVEQELAATGLKNQQLLAATAEVQRISAIGDIDPSQTTKMIIALQTAFKLKGQELTDTLNFMNAASNATSLSLQDIAEATPRAASGLAQLGVNAQQMTIMLVSMREAGVDAAQGANALKSATTRILNPAIVQKATDAYKKFGASIDVQKIVDRSKGNLFDFLKILGQAVNAQKDLNQQQKATAIAALFGTYQFNRLNAALVDIGDAYSGVNNQSAKAIALQKESSESLAHMAEVSEKAMTETPAARLRKAWAGLQIELAELGKPFLAAGARILEAASKFAGFFNQMSGWQKKVALGIAAVMALAGPIIMLGGLFLNLAGQFGKGIGAIAKFIGISKLFTKEEKAAILTAEAQNAAMQKQESVTVTLAEEIKILSAAYEQATLSMREFAEMQGITATRTAATTGFIGPQTQTIAGRQLSSQEQSYYAATSSRSTVGRGGSISNENRLMMARNRLAYDYMRANNQVARDASVTERRIANEARIRQGMSRTISGQNIMMGAMAVSAGAMMISENQTVDSIAKWTMIGALVVPALMGAAKWMSAIAVSARAAAAAQLVSMRAMAGGSAVSALGTAMSAARAGAIGFGAALNAALGPIGWIALGLTAVVGTFMVIKDHNDKIKEQQEELLKKQIAANEAIRTSTASIATNMGKAAGSYQQMANIGGASSGVTGPQSQLLQSYNYYKSEEGQKETAALQSNGKLIDTDQLMDKVRTKFIDLQVLGSDTAEQARIDIQGMLTAAGMSSIDAARIAEETYKRLGDIAKMDWIKPIQDQVIALNNVLSSPLSTVEHRKTRSPITAFATEIDSNQVKLLEQQADKSAEIFNQAIANATSPQQARKYIDEYMNAALQEWDRGFITISQSTETGADKAREILKKYGITSGKEFAKAWAENADFKSELSGLAGNVSTAEIGAQVDAATKSAEVWERTVVGRMTSANGNLEDSILTVVGALAGFNEAAIGVTSKDAAKNLMATNAEYLKYADTLAQINHLTSLGVDPNSSAMLELENQLTSAGKAATEQINELNRRFGFVEGRNATEALNNLMNQVTKSTKHTDDEVKNVNKHLNAMPTHINVQIKIDQIGGIVQSAMQGVQEDMATSAMDSFNSGWDSRMNAMQSAQDRASQALDNRQQSAQDAFDARWERRKEMIDKAYQQRIDAVQREINAEQRADEIRQRIYEKEKARLQAIADAQNTNIDFNTALTEGRLDDAAKLLNNAGVSAANAQMDAEAEAAQNRSQARINALEKKNDRLEKQRDKEIKQLEKMEERMRKHLERIQNARSNALQKQQEDQMASLQRQRDFEKAMLDQRLELFKSYTARNQKDLKRWMDEVGLSYDDFGKDVKAKGESWSTYFQKSLSAHIRQAGTEVMNDNIWENVGKGIAAKLLKGLGFTGLADFRNFVRTGTMKAPEDLGGKKPPEVRHTGGIVGGIGGRNRGNIPNTYKGMHRSERMVRAQKGEYIVNKNSSAKHAEILKSINDGSFDPSRGILGGAIDYEFNPNEGFGGPGALIAAAAAAMFAKGVAGAFQNAYAVGADKAAKNAVGGIFSGAPGTYAGLTLDAEQIKNAAIIASVGSGMGMSTRDLEIGIMTSITESMLRNLSGGDRDSAGLFQQRPSQGWGSFEQVTNPKYAATTFFSRLRNLDGRGDMSPWMAAQSVQRSAFSDGSNYAKYWAAARAIFTGGLTKAPGGGKGYVPGGGGKHWPTTRSPYGAIHDAYTGFPAVDFSVATGNPAYAVADGTITRSQDLVGNDGRVSNGGYYSYGRVIQLRTDQGPEVLYAHLNSRSVTAGQRVKGGAIIGRTGNTGHSFGSHLHFGATNGPLAWLRRGGTIRYDNTPAMLHKGETVLTDNLTKQFKNNVASGGNDRYDFTIDLRGAYIKEDVDIEKAVDAAIAKKENRLGRKRIVN